MSKGNKGSTISKVDGDSGGGTPGGSTSNKAKPKVILQDQISNKRKKFRNGVYTDDEAIIQWSSTGGGWRSMVACMGFANLFQKSSLLLPDHPSPLKSISTVSGSSWFSGQLFYSSEFYNATVLSSPDELRDFVVDWMDSYQSLFVNSTEYEPCEKLYETGSKALCNMAIQYGGNWADFVEDMLNTAAIDAFKDENFGSLLMDSFNRVGPLVETDLFIVSALAPTSRDMTASRTVYLGPNDSDELYTVMIPASYVVQEKSVGYSYGVSSPPKAYSSNSSSSGFSMSDWKAYNLFPQNGSETIANNMNAEAGTDKFFRDPFGGSITTVAGPAAASSALLGMYSGVIPSAYAQTMSVIEYETITTNADLNTTVQKATRKAAFHNVTEDLYNRESIYDFAVCSQWPNPCESNDGYFLDGLATDDTSLPIIIGNYHISEDADLSIPMKIILTNTNAVGNPEFSHIQISMHYSTDFNKNVSPGSFIWLPSYNKQPILSPQIFGENMNEDMIENSLEAIPNSKMTTALFKGTTISNPAFSVKAGQPVEILWINLNNDIPTILAGADIIEEYTDPLASMAVDIATNEELLKRVKAFVQRPSSSNAYNYVLSRGVITGLMLCVTAVVMF